MYMITPSIDAKTRVLGHLLSSSNLSLFDEVVDSKKCEPLLPLHLVPLCSHDPCYTQRKCPWWAQSGQHWKSAPTEGLWNLEEKMWAEVLAGVWDQLLPNNCLVLFWHVHIHTSCVLHGEGQRLCVLGIRSWYIFLILGYQSNFLCRIFCHYIIEATKGVHDVKEGSRK